MNNGDILNSFYSAFQRKDYRSMQASYHDEATFTDPVFGELNAMEVRAMWEMLLKASKDLRIDFSNVEVTNDNGRCHWEAWYTFSKTGRPVHNRIDARFEFRDGKIYRHVDHFDFWRWSRQAIGMPGLLFGWSASLKNKVGDTARRSLEKFMSQP